MNISNTISKILEHISVKDIASPVNGELPEVYFEGGYAVYGNRELIIYLDTEEEPYIYFVDIYGDKHILVSG